MEEHGGNISASHDLNTSDLPNTSVTHLENLKPTNLLLTCNVCNKVFGTKSTLQKHMAIHSGKRPFRCCICNKCFTQKCNLIVHFRKHSGVFPYQCRNCNKGFNRLKTYAQHQARHHNEAQFPCEVCKSSFSQYKDLQAHQPLHTTAKKLHVCVSCQKCFSNKANLKVHSRIHTKELPFECSYCGKRFRQNHVLRRHILVHTGERPYHCTTCHKRFSSRDILKNHALVHLRQFTCSTCNMNFPSSSTLKKHLLLHSGICPFVCSVCDKGFISNHLLKKHEAVHSNNRPFACDICRKRFKYKGNLTVHKLVHSTSAYFVCEICGKDFVHKNNFKRHLKMHSGDRPFVCLKCGACFTVKHSLNVHYLRHTNSAPSCKCDVCGNCFSARSTLNYHKLKHLSNAADKDKPLLNKVNIVEELQNSDKTKPQNVGQKSPVQYLIAIKFTTDNTHAPVSEKKTIQCLDACDNKKQLSSDKDSKLNKIDTQEISGIKKSNAKQQFCKIAPKPMHLPATSSPNKLTDKKVDDNASKASVPPPAATKIGSAFVINTDVKMPTIIPMGQMQFYECLTCKQIFKSKRMLQQHSSMHDKNRQYSCNICSQAFTAKSSLKRHLQRHSGQPSHCCNVCQKSFFQLGNLKIHQQKCSNKTAKRGKKIQVTPLSPSKDLESNANMSDCTEVLRTEQNKLKIDDANENSANDYLKLKPSWTCNKCNRSFKLGVLLKTHKCLLSSRPDVADENISVSHNEVKDIEQLENKSNSLNVCHKIHVDENTLCENPVSVNKATKFTKVCHICDKVFSTDKVLERHISSHTSQKIYKCFCKKRFKNQLSLHAHQLIHALEQSL